MLIFNLMQISLQPLNIGIIGNGIAGFIAASVLRQNAAFVLKWLHFAGVIKLLMCLRCAQLDEMVSQIFAAFL